jgi:hypothetical protein
VEAATNPSLCKPWPIQDGLELGLAGLQVVTTDQGVVGLSELGDTGKKGIIDELSTFRNGRDEESLGVGCLNGYKKAISRVVATGDDVDTCNAQCWKTTTRSRALSYLNLRMSARMFSPVLTTSLRPDLFFPLQFFPLAYALVANSS